MTQLKDMVEQAAFFLEEPEYYIRELLNNPSEKVLIPLKLYICMFEFRGYAKKFEKDKNRRKEIYKMADDIKKVAKFFDKGERHFLNEKGEYTVIDKFGEKL